MANEAWLRLYTDLPDNGKLRALTDAQQLLFVWYLCVFRRGLIKKTTDLKTLAWILRLPERKLGKDIGVLKASNLILEDGTPKGWYERQYVSDTSTDRVREYRDKKREEEAKKKRSRNVTPATSETATVTTPEQTEAETEHREQTDTRVARQSLSAEESSVVDENSKSERPAPITQDEAVGRGATSGLSPKSCIECWSYWQGRDWIIPNTAFRMSRSAAYAQIENWKTNRQIFKERDAKEGGYKLRPDPNEVQEDTRKDIKACPTAMAPVKSARELYG